MPWLEHRRLNRKSPWPFEALSDKRKKKVADFISYLRVKEEIEATKEIIRDDDFLKSIMGGEEDLRLGRFKKCRR